VDVGVGAAGGVVVLDALAVVLEDFEVDVELGTKPGGNPVGVGAHQYLRQRWPPHELAHVVPTVSPLVKLMVTPPPSSGGRVQAALQPGVQEWYCCPAPRGPGPRRPGR
jgi:hypothetical protein